VRSARKTTRIILADDHKILRQGLRSLLDKQPGLEVVAEADDGRTAVERVRELKPDVVVMDIAMPDLNGIEATCRILEACPSVKIIGLSVHSDRQYVQEMLKAGASGYLLKDCGLNDLVSAIRAATAGQTYLSPQITGMVVEGYVRDSARTSAQAYSILSSREREVLRLLAQGKTRTQIAGVLCLSPRTVETHRRRIMDKLDIRSTADLVKFSIREGLTTLDD